MAIFIYVDDQRLLNFVVTLLAGFKTGIKEVPSVSFWSASGMTKFLKKI